MPWIRACSQQEGPLYYSSNIEGLRGGFCFHLRPLDGVDNKYYQKYYHQGGSLTQIGFCIKIG